jgi:hypothetical protein
MSESLAYVAGLIDGDGSVGIACQKRGSGEQERWSYYASVTIGMTQPAKPILEWIHQEWGGSLHPHKTAGEKECPAWQWRVTGDNAVTILRKLLPYLRLKGPQAKLALEVERIRALLPRTNNGGAEWTPQSRAECERIKQKIHSLNAKGPGVRNAEDSSLPARPIAEWNPQTQLWEMDQMDLFSGRREPYSPTWPTSGMTRSGRLLPLPMLVPPIGGSGFSSLPVTERASGCVPSVSESSPTADALLPTPRRTDFQGKDSVGEWTRHSPSLDALLPTPTSIDRVGTDSPPSEANRHSPALRAVSTHFPAFAKEVRDRKA